MDELEKANFWMGDSTETSIHLIAVGLREVMNRHPTVCETIQTSLLRVEGVCGVPVINEEEETILVRISDSNMNISNLVDVIDSLALGIREIRIGSRQQSFNTTVVTSQPFSGERTFRGSSTRKVATTVTQENRSIFIIRGMKCASCVSKVEKIIKAVPGVTSNSVALLTGRADVRHDGKQSDINSAICSVMEASGHPCLHVHSTNTNNKTVKGGNSRIFRFSAPQGLYSADCPAFRALIDLPGVLEVHLLPKKGNAEIISPFNSLGSSSRKQQPPRERELQVVVEELPSPYEFSAASQIGVKSTCNDDSNVVHVKSVGPRDILDCLEGYGITTSRFLNPWVSGDMKGCKGDVIEDDDLISISQQDDVRYWKHLFFLSAILTTPIVIIHLVTERWSLGVGYIMGGLTICDIVSLVLSTPVQIIVGAPFYTSAWTALKLKSIGMDFLFAAATTTAYVFSIGVFITKAFFWAEFPKPCTFETSAMLLTFVSLGRYLESRAKSYTTGAVTSLLRSRPRGALLVVTSNLDCNTNALQRDEIWDELTCGREAVTSHSSSNDPSFSVPMAELETRWVDASLVQVGDLVRVVPGARVPCDGKVVHGESYVDESMLTGEGIPVKKSVGDSVVCGSIN